MAVLRLANNVHVNLDTSGNINNNIQKPGYPQVPARSDLATAKAKIYNFDAGPEGNGALAIIPSNEFTRSRIDEGANLIPLPRRGKANETNMCYRSASLSVLLNCSPFLNFVEFVIRNREQDTMPRENDFIWAELWRLAQDFRNARVSLKTKLENLNKAMDPLWSTIVSRRAGEDMMGDTWTDACGAPNHTQDADQFLLYIFDRLCSFELGAGEVSRKDGTPLVPLFRRLFEHRLVRRAAFSCDCKHKVRQNDTEWHSWSQQINFTGKGDVSLASMLARMLHVPACERGNSTSKCPGCGLEEHADQFFKFLYLPEVLKFQCTLRETGEPRDPDVDAVPNISQRLDMSNLVDDPEDPDHKQENCMYQLKAVIGYPREAVKNGHYVAYLSRNNRQPHEEWDYIDDIVAGRVARRKSLKQVLEDNRYDPRYLLYVRERPPKSNQDAGIEQHVQNYTGQGNTKAKETEAPSQESEKQTQKSRTPPSPSPKAPTPSPPDTPSTDPGTLDSDNLGDFVNAIPSYPNHKKWRGYQTWNELQLDKVLADEGISKQGWGRINSKVDKIRKHLDTNRDYTIYNIHRMSEAADRLGLKVKNEARQGKGVPAKADYISVLSEWDEDERRRLGIRAPEIISAEKKRKANGEAKTNTKATKDAKKTTTKRKDPPAHGDDLGRASKKSRTSEMNADIARMPVFRLQEELQRLRDAAANRKPQCQDGEDYEEDSARRRVSQYKRENKKLQNDHDALQQENDTLREKFKQADNAKRLSYKKNRNMADTLKVYEKTKIGVANSKAERSHRTALKNDTLPEEENLRLEKEMADLACKLSQEAGPREFEHELATNTSTAWEIEVGPIDRNKLDPSTAERFYVPVLISHDDMNREARATVRICGPEEPGLIVKIWIPQLGDVRAFRAYTAFYNTARYDGRLISIMATARIARMPRHALADVTRDAPKDVSVDALESGGSDAMDDLQVEVDKLNNSTASGSETLRKKLAKYKKPESEEGSESS